MKVVLDTNVIVSRFLSSRGPSARIVELWQAGLFRLVVSEPILEEYDTALGYEPVKARNRFTSADVADMIANFRSSGDIVEATEPLRVVADDPKDDMFVECAVAGHANYIVSGDSHLLALQEFRGIQILPPAKFLAMLENEGR